MTGAKTLKSLLYVSHRNARGADGEADVSAIVTTSRSRNKNLEVTGALFSTVSTFAQLIEGLPAAIDELMASILRDPRHRDVKILSIKQVKHRQFSNWTLAYAGRDTHIDLFIAGLLETETPAGRDVEQLALVMEAFGKLLGKA